LFTAYKVTATASDEVTLKNGLKVTDAHSVPHSWPNTHLQGMSNTLYGIPHREAIPYMAFHTKKPSLMAGINTPTTFLAYA